MSRLQLRGMIAGHNPVFPAPLRPPFSSLMMRYKSLQNFPCICRPCSATPLQFVAKSNVAKGIELRFSSKFPLHCQSTVLYPTRNIGRLSSAFHRHNNRTTVHAGACDFSGTKFLSARYKSSTAVDSKRSSSKLDGAGKKDAIFATTDAPGSPVRGGRLLNLSKAFGDGGSATENGASTSTSGKRTSRKPRQVVKDESISGIAAKNEGKLGNQSEGETVVNEGKKKSVRVAKAKSDVNNNSINKEKKTNISSTIKKERKTKSSYRAAISGGMTSSPEVHDATVNNSDGGAVEIRPNVGPLYPPTAKSVVVVESATKARSIQNYLGEMFDVVASFGHVRDLAGKSRSVRPDDDFSIVWEVPSSAWTHLKSIRVALNGAQNLILATDPDREGEAIAWHIFEMLQQQDALKGNINVVRVVFQEITESAIKKALSTPREIDMNLVNAYLARRALDYLIGYSVSPILWRKLPSCRSAGRVQSAALALICDREREIEKFNPQEYWTAEIDFKGVSSSTQGRCIRAHVTHFGSEKLDQLSISNESYAQQIERQALSSQFEVLEVKSGNINQNPPTPYITSTLQQDAANQLHFAATHTMKVAQKLYEGIKLGENEAVGLITYMRTDGMHVSDEAAKEIHSLVKERYGEQYASKNIRKHFKKVRNAQEAHEAIRPTSIRRLPSSLVEILDDDSLKLYSLIWARTMACQMEPAIRKMIQVDIGNAQKDIVLRAAGSAIDFLGYKAVYEDKEASLIRSNTDAEDSIDSNGSYELISKLKVKDSLSLVKVDLQQCYTRPPPRYSEGSLVKKLEELGIGRPSTYASIIKVLKDRDYITIKSRVLHPEFRGRMVSAFWLHHFLEVADYSFTADLENELDDVSNGKTEWKALLKGFWEQFNKYCELAVKTDVRKVEAMLEEKFGDILFSNLDENERICPSCTEGTLRFRVSRVGAGYFIGCDQYPKCKHIVKTFFTEHDDVDTSSSFETPVNQPKLLGDHPVSKKKIYLKSGPYGYYLQLGEDKTDYCPKRISVSETMDVEQITLDYAVELLKYPLPLGKHPDDNRPVILSHARAGYTVKHRQSVAYVPPSKDPKNLTLEDALALLNSKDAKHLGRARRKDKPKVNDDSPPDAKRRSQRV